MKKYTNFNDLIQYLENSIQHTNLIYRNNPFLRITLNSYQIKWVIREYSQFSNEAIHMLLDTRLRVHDWEKFSKEIDHNIEEEKGTKTRGVPHLEIMRIGYADGLNFDVNNYEASMITTRFLLKMKNIFRQRENAWLAGALLALESVAMDEFKVLEYLMNKCKVDNEYVKSYIDGHKIFEVGHKKELMESIKDYINEDNYLKFISGYQMVCDTMSEWWDNLHFHNFVS